MGIPKINISGMVFGRLTVLDYSTEHGKWNCLCSCGKRKMATGGNLRCGNVQSCGCLAKETSSVLCKRLALAGITHGLRQHPIYKLWNNIMTRCYNKKYYRYDDYGGRGITVCKEWLDTSTFIEWASNNGWKKGLQIDRKDNDGPYSPDNCRFVTNSVSMLNQRVRIDNTSGYRGVTGSGDRWFWRLTYKGVTHRGSVCTTAKDAAFLRNLFIRKNRIPATLNKL